MSGYLIILKYSVRREWSGRRQQASRKLAAAPDYLIDCSDCLVMDLSPASEVKCQFESPEVLCRHLNKKNIV